MAYKQNFGPSRKSGRAKSMCGISRITNDAYDAEIGGAADNAYSNYQGKATDASAYVQESNIPTGGMTIDGATGKSSGGNDDVERYGNEGKGKLNRLDRKLKSAQEGQGNPAKEARLQGKIDREKIKSKNKTSRINSKNIDKKNKLTKKEFFKGQKFNEKQKKKGGATSSSHLFKKTNTLKGEGIKKLTSSTPDISKLLKIK